MNKHLNWRTRRADCVVVIEKAKTSFEIFSQINRELFGQDPYPEIQKIKLDRSFNSRLNQITIKIPVSGIVPRFRQFGGGLGVHRRRTGTMIFRGHMIDGLNPDGTEGKQKLVLDSLRLHNSRFGSSCCIKLLTSVDSSNIQNVLIRALVAAGNDITQKLNPTPRGSRVLLRLLTNTQLRSVVHTITGSGVKPSNKGVLGMT